MFDHVEFVPEYKTRARRGEDGPSSLYQEINALGGVIDFTDERSVGRMENLDAVLAILARRGLAQ